MAALVLVCFSTAAFADWRVLVRFDGLNHNVERLFHLPAEAVYSVGADTLSVTEWAAGSQAVRKQVDSILEVKVSWFDANDKLLETAGFVDPRYSHAPLLGGASAITTVVIEEGVYLLQSPEEAAYAMLQFPAWSSATVSAAGHQVQLWLHQQLKCEALLVSENSHASVEC